MHVYGLPSEYFFIQNSWLLPPSVEYYNEFYNEFYYNEKLLQCSFSAFTFEDIILLKPSH